MIATRAYDCPGGIAHHIELGSMSLPVDFHAYVFVMDMYGRMRQCLDCVLYSI